MYDVSTNKPEKSVLTLGQQERIGCFPTSFELNEYLVRRLGVCVGAWTVQNPSIASTSWKESEK
jgi:hypothetical protein